MAVFDFEVDFVVARLLRPVQRLPPCCLESSSLLHALPPQLFAATAGSVAHGFLRNVAVDRAVSVMSSHNRRNPS